MKCPLAAGTDFEEKAFWASQEHFRLSARPNVGVHSEIKYQPLFQTMW